MKISTSLVLFVFFLMKTSAQNDTVYWIEEEISAYSFTCSPAPQLVGLSANNKSVLFYNIEKGQLTMSKDLPLPGQLIQSSDDGSLHAITHDSYVTIVKGEKLKTYPVSAIKSSSIVIVKDLVCITPTTSSIDDITFMCLNARKVFDKWHACRSSTFNDNSNPAYLNAAKGWVFLSGQMNAYNLSNADDCLESMGNYDNEYGQGDPLWFSYDGSRIFLANGQSLTADESPQPHGDFNASYQLYDYNYFSQSSIQPYNIAGIRSDVNDTVYLYSWPYLMPIPGLAKSVPVTSQGMVGGAEEVHVCDDTTTGRNTTYVVVKYSFNGVSKTAVVTLKY